MGDTFRRGLNSFKPIMRMANSENLACVGKCDRSIFIYKMDECAFRIFGVPRYVAAASCAYKRFIRAENAVHVDLAWGVEYPISGHQIQ